MSISPWLLSFASYLEQVVNLLVLLPLGLAWWGWPRLSPALRLLAAYLLCTELTLLSVNVVRLYYPTWYLAIWHGFTLIETLFFFRIYFLTLTLPLLPRLIQWITPCFILFAFLDTFYLEGLQQVNSYTHVLQSALLIMLALFYFEQILRELQIIKLEHDPLFLVSTAVVLYFSGTILPYVFINHFLVASDSASDRVIYSINSVVNIVRYLLFALAFWYAGRQPQLRSPL